MKQHIKLEQLEEIIVNNKIVFDKLVRIIYKDLGCNEKIWIDGKDIHSGDFYTSKGNMIHNLNIGSVMDVLESSIDSPYWHMEKGRHWLITVNTEKDRFKKYKEKTFQSKELVDALWKVIIYMLGEA